MSSETFSPDWLAQRVPVDHRSRATQLLPLLERWWRDREGSRVLDLGSGTGSNMRYLAPRLPPGQEWTLVDHDAALLARSVHADGTGFAHVTHIERVRGDLAKEGLGAIRSADLVTASALLDLISRSWLDRLVEACLAAGCGALLALSWDGSVEWRVHDARSGEADDSNGSNDSNDSNDSDDADDALVLDAVRAHQNGDKGLGPALGPAAGAAAERAYGSAGFRTWLLPSPWRLGAADGQLACALIDGWEEAAAELHPAQAERIRKWAERRRRTALTSGFALSVGHVDLLALPAEPT